MILALLTEHQVTNITGASHCGVLHNYLPVYTGKTPQNVVVLCPGIFLVSDVNS